MIPKNPKNSLFLLSALLCLTFSTTIADQLGPMCSSPLTPRSGLNSMWIQTITHQGTAPFNSNPSSYPIYRNIMDYGAKGDGITDDTAAIQAAIAAGDRCGQGCDSSTVTPALIFFPQGTYLVSSPIVMYYFSQLVGDALNPPTLLASPSFQGIAVLDSDPYEAGGANWYTNQNNFYRQVRNFVIDIRQIINGGTGVHWQVAQATSLTNIVFEMSTASGTTQQGIFMENGSGGFFSDLVFHGGKYGMWIGNQQFTSRNITVRDAQTGIYINWDWGWTFKDLFIYNCTIGVDVSASGVGSVIILDAVVDNTPTFIQTAMTASTNPPSQGSLILDNIQFGNVPVAVQDTNGTVLLAGPGSGDFSSIGTWGQGHMYADRSGKPAFSQGTQSPAYKSSALLTTGTRSIFGRPRPQYEQYDAQQDFVSVKNNGAKGDGQTDDTNALQQTITQYAGCKIIYIPAGVYLITSTITIPAGTRIVGEALSVLSATGSAFSDASNPIPMLKVGNSGDSGIVELSDLLFSTQGAVPGAVLVEWNIRDPSGQQGAAGMWDCHFRIGGALGTNLEGQQCTKQTGVQSSCEGSFLALHLTASSSAYLENVWAWTSDHDLDGSHNQLSVYNARGILIESSQGPVWMYGSASEHSTLYQFNIVGAQNVFLGMIQIETPYYQSVPKAPLPFVTNTQYNDPDYSSCDPNSATCAMAWGLRIVDSENILVYGAGLYSFFQNYDQGCLTDEHCQDSMVSIEGTNSRLYIYNLNTKAANTMLSLDGQSLIMQSDNANTFCQTAAGFFTESAARSRGFAYWRPEIKSFLA